MHPHPHLEEVFSARTVLSCQAVLLPQAISEPNVICLLHEVGSR